MQPEPLAQNETPQPESTAPDEVIQSKTPPTQEGKPAKKLNVAAIVLGVLAFILLLGAAGLGYMAYTLNTQLTATRQELSTTQQELTALQESHNQLQAEHSSLKSDHEKVTADLNQTKTDLDKSNTELAATQTSLKSSQDQNTELSDKIDLARKNAEILYAFSTVKGASDLMKIDSLIRATNDKQMLAKWDTFTSSPSTESSVDFILYLMSSISDTLK